MEILYSARFLKKLRQLEDNLLEDCLEKLELLKNETNHKRLGVHNLHGPLAGYQSASVNYRYRILFKKITKNTYLMVDIGSHDIYK